MKGRPWRKAPVGLPQMRDPDNRCHAYDPRPREIGDFQDCQTDGHYLCRECCHRDPALDRTDEEVEADMMLERNARRA